jgi:hypothetical protein
LPELHLVRLRHELILLGHPKLPRRTLLSMNLIHYEAFMSARPHVSCIMQRILIRRDDVLAALASFSSLISLDHGGRTLPDLPRSARPMADVSHYRDQRLSAPGSCQPLFLSA